jgi:hypothetical protein
MSTADIDALIDAPMVGHQGYSLNDSPGLGDGPTAPVPPSGIVLERAMSQQLPPDLDHLIDRQVMGNTGPSLDAYTPPFYRGANPGFGEYNEQPMFSGPTNMGGQAVGSAEVGVGKPPGWVMAHLPLAQGDNPTRSSYAYQGVFADGQEYTVGGGLGDQAAERAHRPQRAPIWMIALASDEQQPEAKLLSQFPGSAILENGTSFSLSELLGRVPVVGYGVQ